MLTPNLENYLSTDLHHIANVIIDGLGICCFNDTNSQNKFWEVAFLREKKHLLKINAGGKEYEISPDVKTIDFLVNDGSNEPYDTFKKGYFEVGKEFYRTCGHESDFRWVPNFVGDEVPHGKFIKLRTRAENRNRIPVTLVRIPYAVFLTHSVTKDFVILAATRSKDPRHGQVFGATNEVVRGSMYATKPTGLKIMVGNGGGGRACELNSEKIDNCVIDVPYKAGEILRVELTNMDEPKKSFMEAAAKADVRAIVPPSRSVPERLKVRNFLVGDFSHYYNVIDVEGSELTLWASKREQSGPSTKDRRGLNRLGDCNLVRVESDEINSLEPLLE